MINHTDETGRFIGHFQKHDIVEWEKSEKKWKVVACFGWSSYYACYSYQIRHENGSFCNVAEYELKKTQ